MIASDDAMVHSKAAKVMHNLLRVEGGQCSSGNTPEISYI